VTDEQKVLVGAIVIGALLIFWFGSIAARAVRHRRPHRGAVTRASEVVRELDAGDRPDRIELTEHVAWFDGHRGYLALTRTHLIFVPYHRAGPVVYERRELGRPSSRHKKVWKKSRGSFSLRAGSGETLTFKTRALHVDVPLRLSQPVLHEHVSAEMVNYQPLNSGCRRFLNAFRPSAESADVCTRSCA